MSLFEGNKEDFRNKKSIIIYFSKEDQKNMVF